MLRPQVSSRFSLNPEGHLLAIAHQTASGHADPTGLWLGEHSLNEKEVSEMQKILICRRMPSILMTRLEGRFDVDVWDREVPMPRSVLLQRAAGCAAILSMLSDRIDAEVMDAAGENLKVLSNYAVGFNNIDIDEACRRGIRVGHTPDVLTDATADVAVGLMLATARQFRAAHASVLDGAWTTWSPTGFIGQDLRGQTLGVVGMGRIGSAVAQRCHFGWGMNVIYTSRTPKPRADERYGAAQVEFYDLLKRADFVSVHVPLTPETLHLFDAHAFAAMKSTAIFINTARGQIHQHDALVHALRTRTIWAAGLDVTHPEPLPSSDPLLALSQCLVLPHIGSATASTRNAMADIAADNIICGLSGQPLRCEVPSTER